MSLQTLCDIYQGHRTPFMFRHVHGIEFIGDRQKYKGKSMGGDPTKYKGKTVEQIVIAKLQEKGNMTAGGLYNSLLKFRQLGPIGQQELLNKMEREGLVRLRTIKRVHGGHPSFMVELVGGDCGI